MYAEVPSLNMVSFKLLSGQTPTYTNWGPHEPNILGRCVSFQVEDRSLGQADLGKWSADSCNYKHGYFCKKPFIPVPTSPSGIYPGCPPVSST